MQQGISEPIFFGNLVYKFKRIVGKSNFSDQFKKIVKRYHTGQCKRTGGCYNELVVAFFSTSGGVKGKKSIPVDFMIYL